MGKRGFQPDWEKDKKVLAYKKKKLSFREIGKIMELDVKNVYLRYQRALVTYPQKKRK